jgi:hypothetical protein
MWEYIFDSEWKQRADIEALKTTQLRAGSHLRRKAKKLEERIEYLEQELGEVALLCRALLTLLRQSGAVDPAAFEEVVRQIDAEDGVIDGRVTPEHDRPKPKAERPKAPRRRRRHR